MKPTDTCDRDAADVAVRWPFLRPLRARHYLSVLRERGFDEQHLLMATGIDAERLDEAEYRLPVVAVHRLIANVLRLSGDGGIGFDMGLNTDLSALGVLSGALLSCRQVEDTLAVWRRYSEPVIGITSHLVVEIDDEDVWLTILADDSAQEIQRFLVEELLGLIVHLGEVECGVAPRLQAVQLAYPAPAHAARYPQILGCTARFGAACTRLRVSRTWARRSVISHDRELNELCLSRCAELIERLRPGVQLGGIAAQLYALLSPRCGHPPTLDAAARSLHLSARTLKRRLQAEGTSYQSLLRQCRKDVALDCLRSGRMPLHKLAEQLGFADERSFRRAFTAWTGMSPADFRKTSAMQVGRVA